MRKQLLTTKLALALPCVRQTFITCATLLIVLPKPVYALTLGGVQRDSHIGEPLSANITVLHDSIQVNPQELEVRQIPHKEAKDLGVELVSNTQHVDLRLTRLNSKFQINLTTEEVVKEPFVNLLVELSWENGKIYREYSIFLDPPSPNTLTKKHTLDHEPPITRDTNTVSTGEALTAPSSMRTEDYAQHHHLKNLTHSGNTGYIRKLEELFKIPQIKTSELIKKLANSLSLKPPALQFGTGISASLESKTTLLRKTIPSKRQTSLESDFQNNWVAILTFTFFSLATTIIIFMKIRKYRPRDEQIPSPGFQTSLDKKSISEFLKSKHKGYSKKIFPDLIRSKKSIDNRSNGSKYVYSHIQNKDSRNHKISGLPKIEQAKIALIQQRIKTKLDNYDTQKAPVFHGQQLEEIHLDEELGCALNFDGFRLRA